MSRTYDVVVVGGGPAGSTVALLLARAGWSVALVDKDVFPRRKVCGECIAAGNLALLDSLGLGSAVSTLAGAELRSMELWVGERRVRADLPPAAGPRPWGRALGREHLDALLLDQAQAAGADVFQARLARSLQTGASGAWAIRLGAERGISETLQAHAVVLAQGSWSKPLGATSDARPPHRDEDLFAFKANFRGTRLEPGVLPVFAFSGGYGMVVADQERATLAFCVRRDRLYALRRDGLDAPRRDHLDALRRDHLDAPRRDHLDALRRDHLDALRRDHLDALRRDHLDAPRRDHFDAPRRDHLSALGLHAGGASAAEAVARHLIDTCLGVREALRGASLDASWLAAGPLRPGVRGPDPRPGVFRVGNAAGEAHPIIGEGISMALQGGCVLARHLIAGGPRRNESAWRAAATAYAREWRRHFGSRVRVARVCAHAAMRPVLAPVLFPLLQRHPGLLTIGARAAGKTRPAVAACLRGPSRPHVAARDRHPITPKETV